jgi:hypothetical protein
MALFKPISKSFTDLIDLNDAKDHLRFADDDNSQNDMIQAYLTAAVSTAEFMCERILALTVFRTKLEASDMDIQLPYCEFNRITKITASPSDEVVFNVTGDVGELSDYITVDEWTEPPTLTLITANLPEGTTHMIIEMEFGGSTHITESLKQGIKMMLFHFYENPNAVQVGRITSEVPLGAKSLFHLNRFMRF